MRAQWHTSTNPKAKHKNKRRPKAKPHKEKKRRRENQENRRTTAQDVHADDRVMSEEETARGKKHSSNDAGDGPTSTTTGQPSGDTPGDYLLSLLEPAIVCIDGNIGVGKSTLLEELARRGYITFTKGLEDWADVLELFYKEPKRWAFTLQTAVLTNMSTIKRRIDSLGISGEVVFVERCPAAADIFVDLGKARGNFTEVEHAHYYMLRKLVNWEPDIRICLQAPVDECHRRMQNRAREEETELMRDALEYMNTLEAT